MKTIEKMDLLAQEIAGEYGFATCHENDQVIIVEALMRDQFEIVLDALNPQAPEFLNALGRQQVRLAKLEKEGPNGIPVVTLKGKYDNLVNILTTEWDDAELAAFIRPTKG